MRKIIASIAVFGLLAFVTLPVVAATSADVTATVTAQLIAVSVDEPSIEYGVLDVNATSTPSIVITATNGGNVAEDFEIKGDNSTNWTLSDIAVGSETFMHKFATDDDSYTAYTALHNTNYTTLDTSVSASGGTQLFKLILKMPSSTNFTDQQTTIVTILATAS